VVFSVVQTILSKFDNGFAVLLIIIVFIFQVLLTLGVQASMYRRLVKED